MTIPGTESDRLANQGAFRRTHTLRALHWSGLGRQRLVGYADGRMYQHWFRPGDGKMADFGCIAGGARRRSATQSRKERPLQATSARRSHHSSGESRQTRKPRGGRQANLARAGVGDPSEPEVVALVRVSGTARGPVGFSVSPGARRTRRGHLGVARLIASRDPDARAVANTSR